MCVELQRQSCASCRDVRAAFECKLCAKAFCASCERRVHAAIQQQQSSAVRRHDGEEESKGADEAERAHQTHLVAINGAFSNHRSVYLD